MNGASTNHLDEVFTIPAMQRKTAPALPVAPALKAQVEQAPEPDEPIESAEPAEAAAHSCPKCGSGLVDPENLGWCMKCGYCRATADGPALPVREKSAEQRATKPSPLGIVEAVRLMQRIPSWSWLWLWGTAAVICVAILGDMQVPAESRQRAIWCTSQVMLGLAVLIAAQLWSAFLVAPLDDKIGMRDVIIPFRLWALTVKRVPLTRWPVCLGSWALAAILSGLFIVGGLEYWLPKKPKPKAEAVPVSTMRQFT